MIAPPPFDEEPPAQCGGTPHSRQVGWYEVYSYATRLAASHGIALDPTLIAGSPRWCGTPDDDARKMLALILGGVRDALRNDTNQEQMADVSKAVAAAADWPAIARSIQRHRGAYIPRRTA